MIVWYKEFDSTYFVPWEIVRFVKKGILEDMSWRHDPSPSFGTRLRDKNWLRIWVEHPFADKRLGWDCRYTVVIQPDPTIPFGWKVIATNNMYEALFWLNEVLMEKGTLCKFKIGS